MREAVKKIEDITIERGPFRFYYTVLNGPPWVVKRGRDIIGVIPRGEFVPLIQKYGSQAFAAAMGTAEMIANREKARP